MLLASQLNSDICARYPTIAMEVIRLLLFSTLLSLLYSLIRIGLRIRELTTR